MPVSRLTRRRRSSLGLTSLNPIKPGNYGITTSPRNVTFAPNVTPGTFVEEGEGEDDLGADVSSPTDALFPPAETPAPPPTRRRAPPGKRRSQGYIPRPPNAFMLFRADFVRQKHVPGSIETNHGSLSKIIGNCWKALPDQEKKVWETKAKRAKAEHKEMYPNYRFKPVHNKNKNKNKKDKSPLDEPDERRCEEVAQLLLEGKKGDELAAAVRRLDLDRRRDATGSLSPMPFAPPMGMGGSFLPHRRSSSVPPSLSGQWDSYHAPIAIPAVPSFISDFSQSRPGSPVNNISRVNRGIDQRRPSSAGPSYLCAWAAPPASFSLSDLQRDPEPLPAFNAGLFDPNFLAQNSGFPGVPQNNGAFCDPTANPALGLSISPLDNSSADPLSDALSSASTVMTSPYPYSTLTPADGMQPIPWMQHDGMHPHEEITPSASPSGFSATPPPCDFEGQHDMGLGMYAAPNDPSQWSQQEVAIVHPDGGVVGHEGLGYSQAEAQYLQDYTYALEQYESNPASCAIESEGFAFPEDMHYHHHAVEIHQY